MWRTKNAYYKIDMKCHFCKSKAVWRYKPDPDVEGISICKKTECLANLYVRLSPETFEVKKKYAKKKMV